MALCPIQKPKSLIRRQKRDRMYVIVKEDLYGKNIERDLETQGLFLMQFNLK